MLDSLLWQWMSGVADVVVKVVHSEHLQTPASKRLPVENAGDGTERETSRDACHHAMQSSVGKIDFFC
jgi:hypothetical protein